MLTIAVSAGSGNVIMMTTAVMAVMKKVVLWLCVELTSFNARSRGFASNRVGSVMVLLIAMIRLMN